MAAAEAVQGAQEWLARRLQPLTAEDLDEGDEGGVLIYSMLPCRPPAHWEHVWIQCDSCDPGEFRPPDNLEQLKALLFLCNPADQQQVVRFHKLLQCLDDANLELPSMVWVPHSTGPGQLWAPTEHVVRSFSDEHAAAFRAVVETGIDTMVMDEPEGFKLALAIRGRIAKLGHLTRRAQELTDVRRAEAQYYSQLIDYILWTYLRNQLAKVIPPVDQNLPAGPVQHMGSYTLGRMLGRGAYGSVFLATPKSGDASAPSTVMKVVTKNIVKDVGDLQGLRRQIEVMKLLSSPEWQHASLAQFYGVYHSPTHLFLHMAYGGPENLFRRLQDREKPGDAHRPLVWNRCSSLITQCINVLAHIHLGPKVCHRDIKPENFIVHDIAGSPLHIKLVDFDLALIQKDGDYCRSKCGSVPFCAPEVLLSGRYNGMAADIWSLGIVLIEILCGVRIVERVLALEPVRHGGRPEKAVGSRLQEAFANTTLVRDILERKFRPELAPLREVSEQFLSRMLSIDPSRRLDAKGMTEVVDLFPTEDD